MAAGRDTSIVNRVVAGSIPASGYKAHGIPWAFSYLDCRNIVYSGRKKKMDLALRGLNNG